MSSRIATADMASDMFRFLVGRPADWFTTRELEDELGLDSSTLAPILREMEKHDLVRNDQQRWSAGDPTRIQQFVVQEQTPRALSNLLDPELDVSASTAESDSQQEGNCDEG